MAYLYNLPNSTTGLDDILVETLNSAPVMYNVTPLLIIFVYFTVLLGGINRQKARTGTADSAMWSIMAAVSVLLLALIMTMISGFLSITTLALVVMLPIVSVIWLWLDRRQGEA